MKIKASDLSGIALDYAVAKCEGYDVVVLTKEEQRARWMEGYDVDDDDYDRYIAPTARPVLTLLDSDGYKRRPFHTEAPVLAGKGMPQFEYSVSWAQGGIIIERERINLVWWGTQCDASYNIGKTASRRISGPTVLVAAMRCYVTAKLGEEVEIPVELCTELTIKGD
jgi:hypothetical protein